MQASKAESPEDIQMEEWTDYFDRTIVAMKFFDMPAQNRALNLVNGNHCSAELRICKNRSPYDCENVWLDNGATPEGNISLYLKRLPPKNYSKRNQIAGIKNVNLPVRSLCHTIHWLQRTQYHCISNNCYHINALLCEYIGQYKAFHHIKLRESEISRLSLRNSALIGSSALTSLYGLLLGGPLGLGILSAANYALLANGWKSPEKLEESSNRWFDRSAFDEEGSL